MERDCDTCGTTYTAKTQRSRYCSHVCRTKASKAGRARPRPKPAKMAALPVPPAVPSSAAVVEATVRELTEAGRLHTASGQRALALAHLIDCPPDGAWSSVAGWCREHESAMGRALDGVQRVERSRDVLDEVKARRDRIRGA